MRRSETLEKFESCIHRKTDFCPIFRAALRTEIDILATCGNCYASQK